MSSELELSKQRITELEAENSGLRNKLSVSDAEIAELKRRNIEFLRANKEYNERRDAENAKLKARIEELEKNKEDSSAENVRRDVEIAEIKAEVVRLAEGAQARDNNEESKQLTSRQSEVISKEMISGYDQNTIDEIEPQSSVSSNTINLVSNVYEKEGVSDHALVPSAKSSEEKETDAFLNEVDKKMISDRIRQRNREKKLQRKNEQVLIQEINSSMKEKHILSAVTEISANQVRPNSLAERNEERAVHPDIISLYETACENSSACIKILWSATKLGKESERQTQKALRIDDLFEKIGMDKLQYIKTYSADTISKFTDPQIQTIIDHFTEKPNMEFTDEAEDEEQDDEVPEGSDQNNVLEVLPLAKLTSTTSSNPLEADGDFYKMLLGGFDKEVDSTPQSVKEMNEEMPDDSDDDGYNGYGGYNEYGERDRGYYYRDGGYERKTSPMMSPIISPVTAC
ncbi:unnamed protein product [Rhizophagus irregularis]|nr:unnamed protein product [Rhizophagus irregularis]